MSKSKKKTTPKIRVSLVAGYKNMDNENSGTRVYINYDFNNVKIEKESGETILSGYHIVGINADLLYNFNPKFGVLWAQIWAR